VGGGEVVGGGGGQGVRGVLFVGGKGQSVRRRELESGGGRVVTACHLTQKIEVVEAEERGKWV